jgi:hypothetical protein
MKTINYFFAALFLKKVNSLLFCIVLFFCIACSKDQNLIANFRTDRECYIAGDTVHLIDFSQKEEHVKWFFPDGTSATENITQYIIPKTDLAGKQLFLLEAISKNKKHFRIASKEVDVFPYAWFSIDNFIPAKPRYSNLEIDGPNIKIHAYLNYYDGPYGITTQYYIFLPGNQLPNESTEYTIAQATSIGNQADQSLTASLAPNSAYFLYTWYHPDTRELIKYICNPGGKISLTKLVDGSFKASFRNLDGKGIYPNFFDTMELKNLSGEFFSSSFNCSE